MNKINASQPRTITQEHDWLQQYLDVSEMMFVVIGKDQQVKQVNRKACKVLGYSEDEIVGRNWFDHFIPQDNIEQVKTVFNQIMGDALKPVERYENPVICKDGSRRIIAWRNSLIRDENNRIMYTISSGEDVTEQKASEAWLIGLNRLKEELLGPLSLDEKLKSVTDGLVSIFNADFARIWINQPGDFCESGCVHSKAAARPHGCTHKELCLHLRASSGRYTHLDGKVHSRVPFDCYKIGQVASGKEDRFITNDVRHDPNVHDHAWANKTGLTGFAGYKLSTRDGRPLGVMALFTKHPISQREDAFLESVAKSTSIIIYSAQAEQALRESEEQFSLFMKYLPAIVFIKDHQGNALFVNQMMKDVLGDIGWTEKPLKEILPAEIAESMIADDIKALKQGYQIREETVPTRQGDPHIFRTQKFKINRKDQTPLLGGISIDITRQVKAAEQIEQALKEKETLLKEIHHRVKNNLQVIVSLLNLQSNQIEDELLKAPLLSSRQRVYSMALVHEKLYRSKNFSKIRFDEYIDTMVRDIRRIYNPPTNIRFKQLLSPIEVGVDVAIPSGLIVNELVTNTIKYAFPDGRNGTVNIGFERIKKSGYLLTVRDNGVGMPEDVLLVKQKTLGMELVKILTEQMDGNIRIDREKGTCFQIEFYEAEN